MTDPDSSSPGAPLPLAIVNARVWTRDERRPWADAVLARGESIVAVGSSAELRKRAGNGASVIDAGGRLVVPRAESGRLAAGESADIAIVDRAVDESNVTAAGEQDYVFVVERGRVILDRLRTTPAR